MKVRIDGIGWVTPLGRGRGRPGEVLAFGPGRLPALKSRQLLPAPHPRFGRFDAYARAGFGAIALAIQSARLDQWTQKRDFGLVVGTRRGCLQADVAYFKTAAFDGGAMASPNLFAYTLPGCMLGEASIQWGLTGPSFAVDDAAGHLAGIHAALDLMRWALCETAVAGWCDVESTLLDRDHVAPCGAVFFVLTRGADADPWQWDGRDLTYRTRRVDDLAGLARTVLADRHPDHSGE
jgi:3-oxoacyl-[acyl-carrier-protein] synthase II